MTVPLQLEVVRAGEKASPAIRLVARSGSSGDGLTVALTPNCSTIEDLDRSIRDLKARMEALLGEAKGLFPKPLPDETEPGPRTAAEIWAQMEGSGAMEGMKRIFEQLEPDQRRDVANHVFSLTNVFRGAAAIFSQHYDEERCSLE
jgi:hypothetical protein